MPEGVRLNDWLGLRPTRGNMKLTVTIETDAGGVKCHATTDDLGMSQADLNLLSIGALEIAKASLLARRWGVNIGNFDQEPIINPPATKPSRRKKT
jgi:hypothetical protein